MSVMAATVVRELGMMHLVTGSKTYKTASGVITQALGKIDEIPVKRINSETLMRESTTIWQRTSTSDNPDWETDQDRAIVIKDDAATTSYFDTGSEHGESVSNPLRQIDHEDEFGDNELEKLVTSEGPLEILQLILQEQADGFMNEEVTDADDYANSMRWVADAKQSRRAMCESTPDVAVALMLQQPGLRDTSLIPTLLQAVQLTNGDSGCSTTELLRSSSHDKMCTRWREIC
ncbi:unnamed protein product [Sphagnum troendelagicum]